MLKTIPSNYKYNIIDDVLIKGNIIGEVGSISLMRKNAQKEADAILNIARVNADKMLREGYRKGYIEGMTNSFIHIVDAIERLNASVELKQETILKHIKNMLRKSCEDPMVIASVFSEWIKTLPSSHDEIIIHLPIGLKGQSAVDALIHPMQKNLKIDYHEGDKIIMCAGDYIAELSPPAVSENVHNTLLSQLPSSDDEVALLTNQAIEKIIKCCSERMKNQQGGALVTDDNPELIDNQDLN